MCLNGSLSALPLQVYRRAKAEAGPFVIYLCSFYVQTLFFEQSYSFMTCFPLDAVNSLWL